MKNTIITAATLFASTSLAFWGPTCADNCKDLSNGDCGNATAIAAVNDCIAASSCSTADQESIYAVIAQLCANAGTSVTASQEATFSVTSGSWPTQFASNGAAWSTYASGWGGAGGPWGGQGGPGGHGGPGGFGGAWTSGGPWTSGGCGPWSSWSGLWGDHSQFTGIWSGCSTATSSPIPATVTTTISGSVVTGTSFGVQQLGATGTAASGNAAAAPAITQMAAAGFAMAALGVAAVL